MKAIVPAHLHGFTNGLSGSCSFPSSSRQILHTNLFDFYDTSSPSILIIASVYLKNDYFGTIVSAVLTFGSVSILSFAD